MTSDDSKPIGAPLITGLKREKIVQALAAGQTVNQICKANGHTDRTVVAIRESDQRNITKEKERMARQAGLIARLAGRRITQRLRKDELPVHLLPTTFGIAVDKMLALRGEGKSDVGLTLNLLNLTGSQS
jgi:hypothetical protein